MNAPARVGAATVRRSRPSEEPRVGVAQEFGSLLRQMAPALAVLAARYAGVSDEVIRQQAVEVLCVAQGNRLKPDLVVRLVEARIIALM